MGYYRSIRDNVISFNKFKTSTKEIPEFFRHFWVVTLSPCMRLLSICPSSVTLVLLTFPLEPLSQLRIHLFPVFLTDFPLMSPPSFHFAAASETAYGKRQRQTDPVQLLGGEKVLLWRVFASEAKARAARLACRG